jgi:hypothetical protein
MRLPPLGSLNLLLFGYTPCIGGTDQPLAQKSRLKKTMPKRNFFHISGQLMPQKWPSRYENNQNIVINMLPFHTFG